MARGDPSLRSGRLAFPLSQFHFVKQLPGLGVWPVAKPPLPLAISLRETAAGREHFGLSLSQHGCAKLLPGAAFGLQPSHR